MRSRRAAGALALILAVAAPLAAQDESPFRPFDREAFVAAAREHGATDEQIVEFEHASVTQSDAVAAEWLLRTLHGGLDAAIRLAEAGDPAAPVKLTRLVTGGDDARVRAMARYHLGRSYLDADDPEAAIAVFADLLREDRNLLPIDAEAAYFYAAALAEVPMPHEAIVAFQGFLTHFPQAPERYRATAVQRLRELHAQGDSALHELADVMKGVERRIRRTDTGEETQEKQEMILARLEKLIEQIEEQEQAGGAAGGGSNPSSPAQSSSAPEGASRVGNLGRRPQAVEKWGDMPERERRAIQADLQNTLPGRYREMLEQYYKRLGESGGR